MQSDFLFGFTNSGRSPLAVSAATEPVCGCIPSMRRHAGWAFNAWAGRHWSRASLCLNRTLGRLSSVLTALILGTVFFTASKALGQQDQTFGDVDIATGVTRVPSTTGLGDANTLPDAPSVTSQQEGQVNPTPSDAKSNPGTVKAPETGRQTKRILYIVPNFRAVSADQKLPPQTVKEKFKTATLDSVDYSSFIFVAIQSGVAEARNSDPEFRQGAAGYARYYWHTYADYADENLWVEFIFPAPLHQDTRYYTLGRGSFPKRLAYSFSRIAITRTDSGHETFNSSEIFGAGAAAGISGLYYPSSDRTFTKTYQRWITSVAIDGGTFIFKEFWPDINNKFFHQED